MKIIGTFVMGIAMLQTFGALAGSNGHVCSERPAFERPQFEHRRSELSLGKSGLEKPAFMRPQFERRENVPPAMEKPIFEKRDRDVASLQRECAPMAMEKSPVFQRFPEARVTRWKGIDIAGRRLYVFPSHQLRLHDVLVR